MMTRTFWERDLKRKNCGTCEYYSGHKIIKKTGAGDNLEVDWDGTCDRTKQKAGANHGGCGHYNMCGQALKLLADAEAKRAEKEARRARIDAKYAARAAARAAEAEKYSSPSYTSHSDSSSYSNKKSLPKLTKADLERMNKEREKRELEGKSFKIKCWIFTLIGIVSAIIGFVLIFVAINTITNKGGLLVASFVIGMILLINAIVFFIIAARKWSYYKNNYRRY